jgi:hypothetical protein
MKIIGSVFGVLLVLIGCVWVLQGVGVLRGSVMTDQTKWAVFGAAAIVIGVTLLWANRRGSGSKPMR